LHQEVAVCWCQQQGVGEHQLVFQRLVGWTQKVLQVVVKAQQAVGTRASQQMLTP
jgi:hypothetical protein